MTFDVDLTVASVMRAAGIDSNPPVDIVELAKAQQGELTAAIQQTRLRLDALRLIWKGPLEVLVLPVQLVQVEKHVNSAARQPGKNP